MRNMHILTKNGALSDTRQRQCATKYFCWKSERLLIIVEIAKFIFDHVLTTHTILSPIPRGFAPGFVNYKKGCTRLASDKVYQLLAHGRWFSPGTPSSSTTKPGCHDIAEILLKLLNFDMYFHHLTSVCKLYILIFCKAAVSNEAKLGRDSL